MPTGGVLSSQLACLYCMLHEHYWISQAGPAVLWNLMSGSHRKLSLFEDTTDYGPPLYDFVTVWLACS